MSTPAYTIIFQDRPIYTHVYETAWPADTCHISYLFEFGAPFSELINNDQIRVYIDDESHVGTHTVRFTAYFTNYPTAATHVQEFEITIEPACFPDSFTTDPSFVLPSQVNYLVAYPEELLNFNFLFEPSACNLLLSYYALIDNDPQDTIEWLVEGGTIPASKFIRLEG